MSLYPTKTRLALLQAVDDGAVSEHYPLMPKPSYSEWDHGPAPAGRRYQTVTEAIAAQRRAGWVRLGEQQYPGQYKSPRRWEITDLGREILAARAKELAS